MSTEKQKKSEAGEVFLGSLTKRARAAMSRAAAGPLVPPPEPESVDDEAELAGAAFVQTLTKAARAKLAGMPAAPPPEAAVEGKTIPRYAVVECPDGEWAQLRTFKNYEGLARRLQQLEGTDTVVWCFYGVPLGITKGPQRYLELPGGDQKVQIPTFAGGPCKVVDADLLGKIPVQEDGFIGPPELATAIPVEEKVKATGGGDDDDDDDDD